ncbi:TonB-dependent receptor [Methyloraptor flagellatus]|uniref:TonB-dependent siderophore receptor n=1 Tax=Methyloraptor flagellatus TaxID=3162530 RepID=A0AAU7XCA7_9HYPH
MSTSKVPASLRAFSNRSVNRGVEARVTGAAGAGLITAAALAGTLATSEAMAQSASAATGAMPALTVEAQAEPRKKKTVAKPAKAKATAPSAASAAPAGAAAAAGPSSAKAQGAAAPGSNPYADPSAPYKVDRSASSKLPKPILDTPRTVTTIPKEVIEDKGATSFRDLARTTPGLTLGTGEGGNAFGDRVFIRGFDARNDVYVDGVRDSGVNIRENFNTEQVEILKGPSATIGGRGTSGGAIDVVTKQPSFVDFTNAAVTIGTDLTKRTTLDVNKVISPELAVRANGMIQGAHVAGRDYVTDDRWGGAFAATYRPSEIFKLTVDYFHADIDQMPDWGVPFNATTKLPFTESGVNRNNFYGQPNRDFQRARQDVATAKAEVQITDWLTASNKLRYGFSTLDYVASAPGNVNTSAANPANWTVTSGAKSRYQQNQVLADQAELTAKFDTFGAKHTLVGGAEFSTERVSRDTYQALATESFGTSNLAGATLSLWNPNGAAIPWNSTFKRTGTPTIVGIDTASGYVLDTVELFEKLILTGGARVDDYDIKARSLSSSGAVTSQLGRHDTMFNYNLGVTYKVVPSFALYAAYGTSTNPVGAELDAGGADYGGITAANAVLGPEKNKSYEAGAKWEVFERHLLLTASLFQNEKTAARETVGATVQATGAYRVRGVEIGATGNITDRWSVYGGAVFMDSDVTRSATASNVGRQLANIAHESFNLLTKYRLTDELSIGGQATYKSKIYGGTFAANDNVLPSSWRFDVFADYEINKNFSVKASVLNLTNETIYDAFYRSAVPYVYVAPGRSAYLTLNVKY